MYEKRVELMCLLNDRMIYATEDVVIIAKLFDIEFVDTDETHGWNMIDE